MDLGGAAAGGVPCGTLSFFGLPAAGGVPCGLSLSLSGLPAGCSLGGQLLWIWAVLLLVVFRVGHFLSLGFLLLVVFLVDSLSLSGLPAGCSLGGQLLWIWAVLLLVVFRVGHFLSLGFLLLAVFCVDPFSLWASCWLFSWRTTSVDLGGAAAGGVPCGTLSFFGLPAAGCVLCGPFLSLGFLLAVLLEDNFCGSGRCYCWWCSVWDTFFGLPAAGGVPCGLSLSLGFLLLAVFRVGLPLFLGSLLLAVFRVGPLLSLGFQLAVLFEDNFCGSGLCCCWLLCAIVKQTR